MSNFEQESEGEILSQILIRLSPKNVLPQQVTSPQKWFE